MKPVTPSALALECSALVRSLGRRTRIPASELPAIGDRVIATGNVEVFAAKSLLQLAVTEIRKDGDE